MGDGRSGWVKLHSERTGTRRSCRVFLLLEKKLAISRLLDLVERWQADALDHRPDLMALLVGVNNPLYRDRSMPPEDGLQDFSEAAATNLY